MPNGLLKFIAFPAPNLYQAKGLASWEVQAIKSYKGKDYKLIDFYKSEADMFDRIDTYLKNETWTNALGKKVKGAAFELIEIVAHGSAEDCNDFLLRDMPSFADRLKNLTLADSVKIYFSGCNTGLTRTRGLQPVPKSIAQTLAEQTAIHFDNTKFPHHITVYGANGYLSGLNMLGTDNTEKSEYHGASVISPMYDNAQNAVGAACWNGFNNWP